MESRLAFTCWEVLEWGGESPHAISSHGSYRVLPVCVPQTTLGPLLPPLLCSSLHKPVELKDQAQSSERFSRDDRWR